MSNLYSNILPAIKTIEIIGNVSSFVKWLEWRHTKVDKTKIFEGYKFSIICNINTFISGISNENDFLFQNSFLFERANSEIIPLRQLENNCEKIVLLKNTSPYIDNILKSETFASLQENINKISKDILNLFSDIIIKQTIINNVDIDFNTALKYLLIDYTQTYLVQINNNGPTANSLNLLNTKWLSKKQKDKYLEGYKYSIQYLWFNLLGEKEFNKTSLKNIHLADSWKTYKYIENEKNNDIEFIFNNYYNLNEQSCFDSYFARITNEITKKIEQKLEFPVYTINEYFKFDNDTYDKKSVFSDLLNSKNIQQNVVLNKKEFEDIYLLFYWYPFYILNSEELPLHLGVSDFITTLVGAVTLHSQAESEFEKIIAVKFTHPTGKKNTYSYGVLIDTKSASGHYSSGWKIYKYVCQDYSGFSGAECRKAEEIISRLRQDNKIELRELTITTSRFKTFSDEYFNNRNVFLDTSLQETEKEADSQLHKESSLDERIKRIKNINKGNNNNEASKYHKEIFIALKYIFKDRIENPIIEKPINEGRGRIDIVFDNIDKKGFFNRLNNNYKIFCPKIFIECKNYSTDIKNPELDQLSGRLNNKRGLFGILVCREIENKDLLLKRCKDKLEKQEAIIVLEDDDIFKLLRFRDKNDETSIDSLLRDKYDELIM